MGIDTAIRFGPFREGMVDTHGRQGVPPGALFNATGFHFEDGYPRAEKGRDAFTGAEIYPSSRVRSITRYPAPDGNTYLVAACGAGIFKESTAGSGTLDERITVVDPGGTATRSGTEVAYAGHTNVDKTVRPGDFFYFTSDSDTAGGAVASVSGDTITLGAYGGSGTSGEAKISRTLGPNTWVAVADQRLWICDGAIPLGWYGETYRGSGSYTYRDAGLPRPATVPTVTLGADGRLAAGDYRWGYAFGDARGNISDVVYTGWFTATALQKATVSALESGPAWATRRFLYRNRLGGTKLYNVVEDTEWLRASGISESSGTSTITVTSTGQDLISDAHINRYLEFFTTGNEYRVLDNTGTTILVLGDATGEDSGDDVQIAGGFDMLASSSILDVSSDTHLDFDNPAPGEAVDGFRDNAQPPAGLSQITFFRGGGGWAALYGNSRVYVSGKSGVADRPLGKDSSGDGELEIAPHYHDLEADDNVAINRLFAINSRLFAGREDGIWELWNEASERTAWRWQGRAKGTGLLAARSLDVFNGAAFFLGTFAGRTDILRFDGWRAYSVGLERIKATLDGMSQLSAATGVIYDGMYWLSYMTAGTGGQSKTLRYYIGRRIFDKQPWGCGEFCQPFEDSNVFYLLCAEPDSSGGVASGHIRRANGTTFDDLGSAVTRTLETGDLPPDDDLMPIEWLAVHTDVRGA